MIEVLGTFLLVVLVVIAVILLFPVIFVVLLYNSLISKRNRVENTFASIDVLLKKRYDLIPNLVETVKGYMKHEKDVFTKVTELRSKAISPTASSEEKIDLDNQITGFLKTLMVSVENYPQLKANENFLHLQASLTEVEEQISAARRAYNAMVLDYNNAVEMLPTSIVAAVLGFRRKIFFEAASGEKGAIDVGKTLAK
ncbi:MAG: LemA family protein [Candidatus Altiarchaeota archaeon]|nr:LemA family protein [Candidatus Altiarchaeota archaeon]